VRGHEPGVPEEALTIVGAGTDGEDGRQDKGQLLGAHRLHLEGVVYRGDVEARALLPGLDPCLFRDLDVVDAIPGDRKVLGCTCDPVQETHRWNRSGPSFFGSGLQANDRRENNKAKIRIICWCWMQGYLGLEHIYT
jgi:hypothetical protein